MEVLNCTAVFQGSPSGKPYALNTSSAALKKYTSFRVTPFSVRSQKSIRRAFGAVRVTVSGELGSTTWPAAGGGALAAGPGASLATTSRLPAGGSATENSNDPAASLAGYGVVWPVSGSSFSTDLPGALTVAPADVSRLEFTKNHSSPSLRRRRRWNSIPSTPVISGFAGSSGGCAIENPPGARATASSPVV